MHRPDDAAIVDHTADIWEAFAYFDAALAALFEFERARHKAGAGALFIKFAGGLLAFVFFEGGLGIKSVDVRRTAVEEQENGAFGARDGIVRAGIGREGELWAKQIGEAKQAKA